ncbi:MAG TPA: FISUMP domain-containing protein [Bacteroidales bacterium]|nr:FISUMP domain-containing protein [Bacteroidales bacterium]HNS46154.1 FISUMP domain-containing protein [Bacteroidales bacterium]
MKHTLPLIAAMIIVLSFNTHRNQASAHGLPDLNGFSECAAFVPGLPSLPEDDFVCADVNVDGLVNVLDVITLVNYIMAGGPEPFDAEAADVNADGYINVLDIIFMVNTIMQVPGIPCGCVAPVNHGGQTYTTVKIGDQCWFRENLNIGTMISSNEGGQLQTDNGVIEKYCYGNTAANCDIYGGLYEWNEAMLYVTAEGAQGICPADWHIPTDNEWKMLEGTVDNLYPVGDPEWDETGWRGLDAGNNLRETGTSHWYPTNAGATNSSGFTGLPGGLRNHDDGTFYYLSVSGHFYSSSQMSELEARSRYLNGTQAQIGRFADIEHGFSIRCIKGCWPQPSQANAGPDQVNIPGTSTSLAGNTPVFGTGVWHILSGTGGTVADTSSPISSFSGLAGIAYALSWKITSQCGSTQDTVQISFSPGTAQPCPGIPTVEYEGQTYNTVLIGTQCWLKENLNVGIMIVNNGNPNINQTNNGVIEKFCYNNEAANCIVYGGMYEWQEAMQFVTTEGAQGICPDGWHIPTNAEYVILEGTVDSEYPIDDPEWNSSGCRGLDAGGNLKETGIDHWNSPNTGATNESGFTGLPGGWSLNSGLFWNLGKNGYFWTTTLFHPSFAYVRWLNYDSACVNRASMRIEDALSVRCLKDE